MKSIILISVLVALATASPLTKTLKVTLKRHELSSNLSPIPIPLSNTQNAQYYGQISVGTPAQQFHVAFDSSTTNSWIASSQCTALTCLLHSRYDSSQSSTYKAVGDNFTDPTTNVTGFVSQDNFLLGSASIPDQRFVEAVTIPGVQFALAKYDGILGLGFGTGTILDSLVASGAIGGKTFGLYLNRNSSQEDGGELSLGGADTSKFVAPLEVIPVLEKGARGWRVTLDAMVANGTKFGPAEALLNSGTALIGLPLDQADALNKALGGTVVYSGEYAFDCSKLDDLPPVTFTFGKVIVTLQPLDYVLINDTPLGQFCFSGFEGLQFAEDVKPHFVLGDAFLGTVYSYFDQDKHIFQVANLA